MNVSALRTYCHFLDKLHEVKEFPEIIIERLSFCTHFLPTLSVNFMARILILNLSIIEINYNFFFGDNSEIVVGSL